MHFTEHLGTTQGLGLVCRQDTMSSAMHSVPSAASLPPYPEAPQCAKNVAHRFKIRQRQPKQSTCSCLTLRLPHGLHCSVGPATSGQLLGITGVWEERCGSMVCMLLPRGSIYTTIMELGPQNHNGDGLLGPNSILVVYMNPLGYHCYCHVPV